jgi:UDP-N-acetylmuramate-alanine ligase
LPTGAKVYSDYGHHPDAFIRLIPDMREHFPDQRVVVIFEPHQARRLLSLRDDFVASLSPVDEVWIYQPYTAREQRDDLQSLLNEKLGMVSHDPNDLGAAFAHAVGGRYVGSESLLQASLQTLTEDDRVLVASAGNLDHIMR